MQPSPPRTDTRDEKAALHKPARRARSGARAAEKANSQAGTRGGLGAGDLRGLLGKWLA